MLSAQSDTLEYEAPDWLESIRFETERHTYDNPHEWSLAQLAVGACDVSLLHTAGSTDDRMLEAFANGGTRWWIQVRFPDHSTFWTPVDQISQPRPSGFTSWNRVYNGLEVAPVSVSGRSDTLESARAALERALVDIADYAERDDQSYWVENSFRPALGFLQGAPTEFQWSDFQLDHLTPDQKALLEAAIKSWVFGAMGSWNDFWPSEDLEHEYETTSAALHSAIKNALIAVANHNRPDNCPSD